MEWVALRHLLRRCTAGAAPNCGALRGTFAQFLYNFRPI